MKRSFREWKLEFIALGLSFGKVGPGIFCTTMHRRIFGGYLRVFDEPRDPRVFLSTLLPWFSADWLSLFPKLNIVMKWMRFEAVSSIQQTVTREAKAIRGEAFSGAFDSLYERCKRWMDAGGDYIT
jgi:hypothetical protein